MYDKGKKDMTSDDEWLNVEFPLHVLWRFAILLSVFVSSAPPLGVSRPSKTVNLLVISLNCSLNALSLVRTTSFKNEIRFIAK